MIAIMTPKRGAERIPSEWIKLMSETRTTNQINDLKGMRWIVFSFSTRDWIFMAAPMAVSHAWYFPLGSIAAAALAEMELRFFLRSGNETSMQPTRCRRKKGANFGRKANENFTRSAARKKNQIKTDQFRIAKFSHQQFRFYFKFFELLPSSRFLRGEPSSSLLLFREFFSRAATSREITKQKSCKRNIVYVKK